MFLLNKFIIESSSFFEQSFRFLCESVKLHKAKSSMPQQKRSTICALRKKHIHIRLTNKWLKWLIWIAWPDSRNKQQSWTFYETVQKDDTSIWNTAHFN